MNDSPATRVLLASAGGTRGEVEQLRVLLGSNGCARFELEQHRLGNPEASADHAELRKTVEQHKSDVVILCPEEPSALECATPLLALARREEWQQPILVAARFPSAEAAIEVLKLGAADCIHLPPRPLEVIPRLWRLTHPVEPPDLAVPRLRAKLGLSHIVGENPAFTRLLRQVPRVARCEATVLITGETGTGKDVIARAVHYLSRRSGKPFVPVNCGAIPPDLVENEFFGHEPGAFTNAAVSRRGVVKEADGGTLFLDEIDCLPALAQVKLLRFLQDGHFRALGSERSSSADVRIIAASNADLAEAVTTGRFRRDLYYRLNVLPLSLPPVRERPEDIPLLACHFVAKYTQAGAARSRALSRKALQKLLCYDWPGNVRELENVIERAVALAERPIIGEADIVLPDGQETPVNGGFQAEKDRVVKDFERTYLRRVLLQYDGNISRAAVAAQKDRRAFWELLRKHRLAAPTVRSVDTSEAFPARAS